MFKKNDFFTYNNTYPNTHYQIIQSLQYFEEPVKLNEEEDTLCPICIEHEAEVKTHCNHLYCKECLIKWVSSNHTTCPYCRDTIHKVYQIVV